MTNKGRTKECLHCGNNFTESPNDSNTQWEGRKYCGYLCLNRAKDHSWQQAPIEEKVWDRVIIGEIDKCWGWRGAFGGGPSNRPVINAKKCHMNAARALWAVVNGRWPEDGEVIRHTCDNPQCMNPSHLAVGTQADNVRDMHERGRAPNIEDMPHTKLTWGKVRDMRADYLLGVTQADIARKYGIDSGTVSRIMNGKSWVRGER